MLTNRQKAIVLGITLGDAYASLMDVHGDGIYYTACRICLDATFGYMPNDESVHVDDHFAAISESAGAVLALHELGVDAGDICEQVFGFNPYNQQERMDFWKGRRRP